MDIREPEIPIRFLNEIASITKIRLALRIQRSANVIRMGMGDQHDVDLTWLDASCAHGLD